MDDAELAAADATSTMKSEMVCFLADRSRIVAFDDLVKICSDFYTEEEIMSARQVFGDASVAMYVLPPKLNGFLAVNFGWGLGGAMGIWCCGGVSGGHINPAVTLTMAILGRLPLVKVLVYWIGQYLGAFTAAACVFGVYYDAIDNFDGGERAVVGVNATAGIFATYPVDYLSIASAFGDQVFGTMLLVLCVLAITDSRNIPCPNGLIPLAVGLLIGVMGMTFGQNCGYPINPARDLGPRLFTAIAGYGTEVFTAYDYYFWVPIVGPHVGALCGAWAYLLLVGVHIPNKDQPSGESHDLKDVKFAELDSVNVQKNSPRT